MSANPPPAGATGLLLSDDLLFSSRITSTARDHGLQIKPARSAATLVTLAAQECPRCIILDLNYPGLQLGELLASLRQTCSRLPRLIAYGSHVDAAGLRAAREAGCEVVLPRSKFVEELPHAIVDWMS